MAVDKGMRIEALRGLEEERQIFQRVFGNPDGIEVLAWIANECGAWSQDPAKAKPELVALYNRLLGKLGALHTANLVTLAQKTVEAANFDDIAAERRSIREFTGEA